MDGNERKFIAFHEAGHVAALWLLKEPTRGPVTIDPAHAKSYLSHLPFHDPQRADWGCGRHGDDLDGHHTWQLAVMCFAGREAELRAGGDGSVNCTCLDFITSEEANWIVNDGGEEKLRATSSELIDEHWVLIEQIAHDLLEHTTLPYDKWRYWEAECRRQRQR